MEDNHMMMISIAFSVGVFVLTLVGIPIAIVRMPSDYFCREQRRGSRNLFWVIAKNVLGVVLVVLGVVMLVLPGQGILTLLAGLLMMDFPGKQRLVHKLVTRPAVQRGLSAIRERAGKPPLQWPPASMTPA